MIVRSRRVGVTWLPGSKCVGLATMLDPSSLGLTIIIDLTNNK